MTKRRDFLKNAGLATAAVGATALSAPYVRSQSQIKWRLQTYAGPALAEHVIKPSIDAFNKVANGEMVIELYTSDQLVPRASCSGRCSAAPSTRFKVTKIRCPHRSTCPCSAVISPSRAVTVWMSRCCSTSMD